MHNIDAIVTTAAQAVYESRPRFPYLLVCQQADGTYTASTWAANTTPAEVHDDADEVLFWGEIPMIDCRDLFTSPSQWEPDYFRAQCDEKGIGPEGGWAHYDPSELPMLAERLWDTLTDEERDAHCRTFWEHYAMSDQIRQVLERAIIEDMKAALEPGYQLWRLKTGADARDALIVAVDWQEAANDACFEHDTEALPAHWHIELVE